ncbi:MAG TPA: DUF3810 domain-containing protein [Sunxiuqinia sp.]|nr:DUF3810 domain-containing protein [Sunxiuqinia sp.]
MILVWVAAATFILTELFSVFPSFIESVYSESIYPIIASILTAFSHWFPFSLDDLFYILLIGFGVVCLLLVIFRKMKIRKFLVIQLNSLALVYILFYWLWGFNYFREPLNQRLELAKSTPNTEEFVSVFKQIIRQTNSSYILMDSINKPQIDSLVEASYQRLSGFLKLDYPSGARRAKPITFSDFFAAASISGYYGPFLSEVQINRNLLPVEYPFVLAHEKAHQFGITSEAEANFYAWLVCTQSPSKLLQYSANLYVLRYFIYEGYELTDIKELAAEINEPVKLDLRKIREHWMKLRNKKIDAVATKVNDAYLKTNKVEKGIEDYTGVVQFVMDFETNSLAREKVIGEQLP